MPCLRLPRNSTAGMLYDGGEIGQRQLDQYGNLDALEQHPYLVRLLEKATSYLSGKSRLLIRACVLSTSLRAYTWTHVGRHGAGNGGLGCPPAP